MIYICVVLIWFDSLKDVFLAHKISFFVFLSLFLNVNERYTYNVTIYRCVHEAKKLYLYVYMYLVSLLCVPRRRKCYFAGCNNDEKWFYPVLFAIEENFVIYAVCMAMYPGGRRGRFDAIFFGFFFCFAWFLYTRLTVKQLINTNENKRRIYYRFSVFVC